MGIKLGKYKAFFFDFDGVIVDTLHIKTRAFGNLFKQYGRNISQKVMEYHRNNGGVSRYEKFRYYYVNLLKKKINQRIMTELDRDYSNLVVKKVIAADYINGAMAFIKRLRKARKDCFVISATPQKEIRYILKRKKIKALFKDAVGSPNNKKANLKYLLSKYSIIPGLGVYFGDAKSDYIAAKKNKVDFVGVVNDTSGELKVIPGIPKIRDFTGLK